MKFAINMLFAVLALAAVSLPLWADELKFTTGETLSHTLSVCLDKQDALDILAADEKGGPEEANKLWMAKPKRGNIPVVGGVVGKVVKSIKSKRGGEAVVTSAVEILANGEVVGYFMTTAPVNKAQRNT